jgi:5-hydroxyisourate hydrolase
MSGITTHVLDTGAGRPAAGLAVALERMEDDGSWTPVGSGVTDGDGRLRSLLQAPPGTAIYRLTFETEPYFATTGTKAFYPRVVVVFRATAAQEHYHVPLLLSPFAYSTYRGS